MRRRLAVSIICFIPLPLLWAGITYGAKTSNKKAADLSHDQAIVDDAYHKRINSEHPKWSLSQLNDAIKKQPDAPGLYVDRAYAYFLDGDIEMSLANTRRAVAIDPRYARAYIVRSMIYAGTKQWPLAFQDLSMAAKVGSHPVAIDAIDRCAFLHRENRDYDESLKEYNLVIDSGMLSKIRCALAIFQRGEVYYRTHKMDRALVDFDSAIKMDPNPSIFYLIRARAYAIKGKLTQAVRDYTTVVDQERKEYRDAGMSSDVALAYRERASVYDRLGNAALAGKDRRAAANYDKQQFDAIPFRAK